MSDAERIEPPSTGEMPPALDASALGAERLREAYGYWLGKRLGRLMPSPSDIDPLEFPALLPYAMLIDVTEPLDFRYRLIGAAARSIMRRDYTGMLFSEVAGKGAGSVLWRGCALVVHSKLPLSMSPPYIGAERSLHACENLLLPLSDNRIGVTMIFKVISFERGAGPV